MAFGDPAVTTTLAHLPDARTNLAAVGVAKSLAVFFESPIIMVLHASNTLAGSQASRGALRRFTLLAMAVLSGLLTLLALPAIFAVVGRYIFGIDGVLAARAGTVVLLMALWPAAIAWRRYYQGLLIRYGHSRAVAWAGIGRLVVTVAALTIGYRAAMSGYLLGGLTLVGGIVAEALFITLFARSYQVTQGADLPAKKPLPTDMKGVWGFYWPLANSMLVVWGGRALLFGIIARSVDGGIALAVWPAAWGLVLLVANATRMVQQVIIRNRHVVSDRLLLGFALSVGLVFSTVLLILGATSVGNQGILAFVGSDLALASGVIPVVLICSAMPLIIALQNAIQGFLIESGRTGRVNLATWLGTSVLLLSAGAGVALGVSGAVAAAAAMALSLIVETGTLFVAHQSQS